MCNNLKFLYRGKTELPESAVFEDDLQISVKPLCGYQDLFTVLKIAGVTFKDVMKFLKVLKAASALTGVIEISVALK